MTDETYEINTRERETLVRIDKKQKGKWHMLDDAVCADDDEYRAYIACKMQSIFVPDSAFKSKGSVPLKDLCKKCFEISF